MDESQIRKHAERFLGEWNSQDPERVASVYTDDVIYVDPSTRGAVEGGDALRRYLKKLLAKWTMKWSLREAFPLEGKKGYAALWRASLQYEGKGAVVEVNGMDLILMRGDLVERNEVYFDRSVLAPLMGIETQ